MIANSIVESITQFGVMIAIVVIVAVMLATTASGKSITRFLLPRAVTDVVSKLLPRSLVTDAKATDFAQFQLQVSGTAHLKTVHVRRLAEMTIAWTYDESIEFPQTGMYAFNRFRHNLNTGAALIPEKVKARIDRALTDTLKSKQFQPADTDVADIWISVFGALENEVSLQAMSESFERPDDDEWREALRTAVAHGRTEEATTLGRGSLVLDIVDSQTKEVIWRAASIADILVDVDDAEKERRTGIAIGEMLQRFPPSRV